jgi:hypothetical protein
MQTISQYLLYFVFRNVYNVKTNVHLLPFLLLIFPSELSCIIKTETDIF